MCAALRAMPDANDTPSKGKQFRLLEGRRKLIAFLDNSDATAPRDTSNVPSSPSVPDSSDGAEVHFGGEDDNPASQADVFTSEPPAPDAKQDAEDPRAVVHPELVQLPGGLTEFLGRGDVSSVRKVPGKTLFALADICAAVL